MNTEWLSNVSTVSLVGNQVAFSILTYLFIIWFPLICGHRVCLQKECRAEEEDFYALYTHIVKLSMQMNSGILFVVGRELLEGFRDRHA
jgi:hypothetical protein